MQKFSFALLIIFSLVSGWAQVPLKAPPEPTPTAVKLSVDRKGNMTTADGSKVDYRLFAFTTKDEAGKEPLQKGEARHRPKVMYISADLLKKNSLDDPKSDQYAKFKDYMTAEKVVNRSLAKRILPRHNGRRIYRLARLRPRRVIIVRKTSNKTIEDLKAKLKTVENERDTARTERDNADSKVTALENENKTLRMERDNLKTKLDEANKKLVDSGLAPVLGQNQDKPSPTPTPTPPKGSYFEGHPWEPAWWNLYGKVPWWSSWFSSSSGYDWNYTSIIAVWTLIVVLFLTALALLFTSWLRPRKVRVTKKRYSMLEGSRWNRLKPWRWNWGKIHFRKSTSNYVPGQGISGIEYNPTEPVSEDVNEITQEPLEATVDVNTNGAQIESQSDEEVQTHVSPATAGRSRRKTKTVKSAT